VALGVVVLAVTVLAAAPAGPALPRLLMVTHSGGYEHEVVRRPEGGGLSTAERVVAELARRSGRFEVTHVATTAELAALTVAVVRAHQALLFFTTGELPLGPAVRQAIFERVREGAGFIGVHSATDTWFAVPEYRQLVGATFDGHPWHGRVRIVVEDRTHPATRHLGEGFEISDEIYQFRDWSQEGKHVLLSIDNNSIDASKGKRADNDYAVAWVRDEGQGRVFYTSLGHGEEVWHDPRYQQHIVGGIAWTMRVQAPRLAAQ
jgi:type 1 glutamine amidotransferase